MKIGPVLFTFMLASDLLVEAYRINVPKYQSNSGLLPRRKKKKPPEPLGKPVDGWPKYFHEPGGNDLANHYDSRYEHGILSYEEKQDTQVHMMRAYLDFFKKNNMETWLAHGTLLGWWWNGKVRHLGRDCRPETHVGDRCFHGIGMWTHRFLGLH